MEKYITFETNIEKIIESFRRRGYLTILIQMQISQVWLIVL